MKNYQRFDRSLGFHRRRNSVLLWSELCFYLGFQGMFDTCINDGIGISLGTANHH